VGNASCGRSEHIFKTDILAYCADPKDILGYCADPNERAPLPVGLLIGLLSLRKCVINYFVPKPPGGWGGGCPPELDETCDFRDILNEGRKNEDLTKESC